MMQDRRLLEEYVATRSQSAFSELARRYTDLVYTSARRQLGGDAHLAEDVTQAVFIVLAEKAASVPRDRPLSAWLLKVTGYCAANARRQRGRRVTHERRAADMSQVTGNQQAQSQWEEMAPLLDQGISKLPAADRDALLLRFFEQRNLREVGEALGVSEEAAQKRVSRAVDKLRDFFHRRGATTASASALSALSALLMAQAVQAAPVGLPASAASAAAAAAAGSASTGSVIAKGALIVMAQRKLEVVAMAVLLAAAGLGGGVAVFRAFATPAARTVVLDAQAKETNPINRPSPWPVKFADGTTVEVLAVNDPTEPQRWWSPDGSPADEPAFRASGSITMSYPFARRIDLILRVRGVGLEQKTLTVRADPRFRTATLLSGTSRERLIKAIMAAPLGARTIDLRIGLANQPWQEEIAWDVTSDQPPATDGLRFGALSEEDGQTVVQIFRPAVRNHDRDERVVVVANGRELRPIASHSRLLGEELYRFRCARDEVSKVALQSRAYEWMEMRNLSVDGAKGADAVQVSRLRVEAEQNSSVRGTTP